MAISATYPFNLQNGNTADATQVMANFLQIQNDVNANAAQNGVNSDITELTGLAVPLSIAQGGTSAATAAGALAALGAAPILSPTFTGIPAAPTPAPGTNTTQIATTGFVAAALAAFTVDPVGAIKMIAHTAIPAGYLECNGQAVDRTTYAPLFAAIGTVWGAGNGTTTFNVPNMARRVPVGRGGTGTATLGNAVGNVGGSETNVLTTPNLPAHSHIQGDGWDTPVIGAPAYGTTAAASTRSSGYGSAPFTTLHANTSDTGSGTAHNIMQPGAVFLFVIKT